MPDANNNFKGSGWSRAREDGWEKAFGQNSFVRLGTWQGWYAKWSAMSERERERFLDDVERRHKI